MASLAGVAAALLLLLLLLSYPAVQARVAPKEHFAVKIRHTADKKVAKTLCGDTDYPDLCASAAKDIRGPVNEKALVKASILAAIKKVQEAKSAAVLLGSSNAPMGKDKMAQGNLQVCLQVYDSAIFDLNKSLAALKDGAADDLNIRLSAAMTDVDTCDDAYAEAGQKSPLATQDGVTGKHASNALSLSKLLN